MRFRIAALMLLFVLPVLYPFAAPAPERPYAILDIGPPPKGKTAEQHCKTQIGYLTALRGMLFRVWCNPEVQKLRLYESVRNVTGKDFDSWLKKTIRVMPEIGGRRLRLTLQAGAYAEQAIVINTLLRIYVRDYISASIRMMETVLRSSEEAMPRLAKLIKEERDVNLRRGYQAEWDGSKTRDADFRQEIARLKDVAVIKWAK